MVSPEPPVSLPAPTAVPEGVRNLALGNRRAATRRWSSWWSLEGRARAGERERGAKMDVGALNEVAGGR